MTRSIYVEGWRIDVDYSGRTPRILAAAEIARVAASALGACRAPRPASLGLTFADDGFLASLNWTHMHKRGATDVLSFPMLPRDAFQPGGSPADFPRPPRSRLHLGDIAISVERAIDQAESGRGGQTGDVRWSPADEIRLLVTHGVLHICGWDHATAADERAMRDLERRLLRGGDRR